MELDVDVDGCRSVEVSGRGAWFGEELWRIGD